MTAERRDGGDQRKNISVAGRGPREQRALSRSREVNGPDTAPAQRGALTSSNSRSTSPGGSAESLAGAQPAVAQPTSTAAEAQTTKPDAGSTAPSETGAREGTGKAESHNLQPAEVNPASDGPATTPPETTDGNGRPPESPAEIETPREVANDAYEFGTDEKRDNEIIHTLAASLFAQNSGEVTRLSAMPVMSFTGQALDHIALDFPDLTLTHSDGTPGDYREFTLGGFVRYADTEEIPQNVQIPKDQNQVGVFSIFIQPENGPENFTQFGLQKDITGTEPGYRLTSLTPDGQTPQQTLNKLHLKEILEHLQNPPATPGQPDEQTTEPVNPRQQLKVISEELVAVDELLEDQVAFFSGGVKHGKYRKTMRDNLAWARKMNTQLRDDLVDKARELTSPVVDIYTQTPGESGPETSADGQPDRFAHARQHLMERLATADPTTIGAIKEIAHERELAYKIRLAELNSQANGATSIDASLAHEYLTVHDELEAKRTAKKNGPYARAFKIFNNIHTAYEHVIPMPTESTIRTTTERSAQALAEMQKDLQNVKLPESPSFGESLGKAKNQLTNVLSSNEATPGTPFYEGIKTWVSFKQVGMGIEQMKAQGVPDSDLAMRDARTREKELFEVIGDQQGVVFGKAHNEAFRIFEQYYNTLFPDAPEPKIGDNPYLDERKNVVADAILLHLNQIESGQTDIHQKMLANELQANNREPGSQEFKQLLTALMLYEARMGLDMGPFQSDPAKVAKNFEDTALHTLKERQLGITDAEIDEEVKFAERLVGKYRESITFEPTGDAKADMAKVIDMLRTDLVQLARSAETIPAVPPTEREVASGDPYTEARKNIAEHVAGISPGSKEFKGIETYLQFVIANLELKKLTDVLHLPDSDIRVIQARKRENQLNRALFSQSPGRLNTNAKKRYAIGHAVAQNLGLEYRNARVTHPQRELDPQERTVPQEHLDLNTEQIDHTIVSTLEGAMTALHDVREMFGIVQEPFSGKPAETAETPFAGIKSKLEAYIGVNPEYSPTVRGLLEKFTEAEMDALGFMYHEQGKNPMDFADYRDAFKRYNEFQRVNASFQVRQSRQKLDDAYDGFAPQILEEMKALTLVPDTMSDQDLNEMEIANARAAIAMVREITDFTRSIAEFDPRQYEFGLDKQKDNKVLSAMMENLIRNNKERITRTFQQPIQMPGSPTVSDDFDLVFGMVTVNHFDGREVTYSNIKIRAAAIYESMQDVPEEFQIPEDPDRMLLSSISVQPIVTEKFAPNGSYFLVQSNGKGAGIEIRQTAFSADLSGKPIPFGRQGRNRRYLKDILDTLANQTTITNPEGQAHDAGRQEGTKASSSEAEGAEVPLAAGRAKISELLNFYGPDSLVIKSIQSNLLKTQLDAVHWKNIIQGKKPIRHKNYWKEQLRSFAYLGLFSKEVINYRDSELVVGLITEISNHFNRGKFFPNKNTEREFLGDGTFAAMSEDLDLLSANANGVITDDELFAQINQRGEDRMAVVLAKLDREQASAHAAFEELRRQLNA